jgi:hypothetical protein
MRHRNNMNNVFETRIFDILFLLVFWGRKISVHEGNFVGERER